MTFPTSFCASTQIWLHRGEQLTTSAVLDRIEHAFRDLGASIIHRDEDTIQFRAAPISFQRSLAHVGSGWISIVREEHCITMKAEVQTSPYTIAVLSVLGIATGVATAPGGPISQLAWIGFLWLWFSSASYFLARSKFASFLESLERLCLPPPVPGRLTSA
jgi:hypothetical protein